MLKGINLKKEVEKDVFKAKAKILKTEMARLEQEIKKANLPVIVIFEGLSAAGKGSMIAELISDLDPRSFKVRSTVSADMAEIRMPLMWRFWRDIPSRGTFSILDRSWYQETAIAKLEGGISKDDCHKRYNSINVFERQLCDDRYLIVKFFLDITQKEQSKRFKKLEDSKSTKWRITGIDKKRNKHFDAYTDAFDEMLENTSTKDSPWHIVSSMDKKFASLEILKIVTESIKARLENSPQNLEGIATNEVPLESFSLLEMPKIENVDLDKLLSDCDYDKELDKQQKILSKLHDKIYKNKIPLIIAFEGWDAAGKGGTIKRIAAAFDPRGCQAVPVAAPDNYELSRHYLWRFWSKLPKTGHIAIFDRTWYGRVLVERVERFTPESRCEQAYQEINEFEKELHDSGAIIIKFWLQIDKDEQLKRFNERQTTPEKQWKITDDDWRNREKWDEYEIAVDDMIAKTSTEFSSWHIIEANDKNFARIKALKIVNEAIQARLDKK